MIPSSFYEDYQDYGCGMTEDQFTDIYTQPVNSITDFMVDKVSAYWLGYISTDNLPMAFRYSVGTYTEEEGFIFRDTTKDANFPCGYCTGNQMPGTTFYGMPQDEVNIVYIDDTSYASWPYNNISLFNSLHPEYSGYANYNSNNVPSFDLKCYIFDEGENFRQQYDYGWKFNNYRSLYNFLNGEENIAVSILGHDITLSKEDFETGTCYKEAEDHYYIRIFLTNYRFNLGRVKNDSYENPTVLPAFMTEVSYTNENEEEGSWLVFGNQGVSVGAGQVARVIYGNIQWALNWWGQYGGGARAGLNGQITQEAYLALRSSPYSYWYVYDNNVLLTKESNDYIFYCIFPIGEIKKHFSLMYRVDISPSADTPSYVLGLTYATNVSEDNEFLANLKTGNITNQDFKDSLRPWQYSDIAVNEFTEDDVPPYEPEPPTPPSPDPVPTESKYTGDPTIGWGQRVWPPGSCVYYALTAADLKTFIERLWNQPKNFYEEIQIAGRQQDSIFDYINSLKYFPLNIDWSSSTVSPIHLGTGAVFRHTDGTPYQEAEVPVIPYKSGVIGYWDLNSMATYHWRKNFLDYSPYSKIIIYLPYAGTVELSPEQVASHKEIWETKIYLQACVEIPTGSLTYIVFNDSNVVLAQKTIKIAIDLPLAGNNESKQATALLSAQFSTIKQLIGMGSSMVNGAMEGGLPGAIASVGIEAIPALGDIYLQNSLANKQVPVEIGSFGGVFSNIAVSQKPYITIYRQKVSNPSNYGHTTGYLVEGTYKIKNLNGFTRCKNIDLSGINQATDEEKVQIKKLLENGFYA